MSPLATIALVKTEIDRAVTDAVIRRLATDQSFHKGYDYFKHGHVESLEGNARSIRAVVRGTRNYMVTLSSDDGILDYACDARKAPMRRSANIASPLGWPG